MNNNEENKNVNANEQPQSAQVENKKSWFGTAISAVKNTAGTVTSFAKEHKTMTAVGAGVIIIGTIATVVLKKKGGNADEPATDAEGFDNK
jgi:hypothetical protein